MLSILRRLIKAQDGVAIVEYVLIASLISIVAIAALSAAVGTN
jgi:Flp pilus assembly pilin Flp